MAGPRPTACQVSSWCVQQTAAQRLCYAKKNGGMVITPLPPHHYYYHVPVYCRSIHFFWVFFWHDNSVCSNGGMCAEICRRVTSSQHTILQNIGNILVNLFSCSSFACGSSLIFHRFSLILASKTLTYRFQASELYRTKVWYTNTFAVFLISYVRPQDWLHGLHDWTVSSEHLRFMFLVSSLFFFVWFPCGRLSWLHVSFWAHVNIVHHIISYHRWAGRPWPQ